MQNDDYEGWPTTRRFPRTMNEAFPDDAANAKWWYPPEQRWQDKLFMTLCVWLWIALATFLVKD
jgi:hypothetical protein